MKGSLKLAGDRPRSFTLIELLVVIAIIALLASLKRGLGLQQTAVSADACRPRALTRRFGGLFGQALGFMRRWIAAAHCSFLLAAFTPCLGAIEATAIRPTIDLSGEWQFRIDPDDIGIRERWFADENSFDRRLVVPGAWNAQGVRFQTEEQARQYERTISREQLSGPGRESEKLFSVYPGPGWYRRAITIPPDWAGKVIWLHFGGVHRNADVWVNGHHLGAHVGYVVPFQYNITPHIKSGEQSIVTVRVDARRQRDVDPLMGCLDTLDFLYVTWGGIYRKVTLIATPSERIEEVFVTPRLADQAAEVQVRLAKWGTGAEPDVDQKLQIEIRQQDGVLVGQASRSLGRTNPVSTVSVHLPSVKLWSPAEPHLYTAIVGLVQSERVVDAVSTRFGMRELTVRDGKFFLNGQPIFLRGYGDDCIYPNSIAPPADKGVYRRRLAVVKEYGFNYARHHSWVPPEEYLDAADEVGVMLQPEFPIAYRWDLAKTRAGKELYLQLWQELLRTDRNHPSVVTWCMGNELYDSFPEAAEMYRMAKELDPTRLVIDSDGVSRTPRSTLDFWAWQFGESSLAYRNGKYDFGPVDKPVVAHEMGYFVTLPDLSQLPLFQQGLRPYWLYEARDLASKKGVLDEYPAWVKKSNLLQAQCLKINIEAARRSHLQGYSAWLFQDYPWCAEGVVDMFYRAKALTAPMCRKFNAPTVLLLGNDMRTHRFGQEVQVRLLVSRYEESTPTLATLSWQLNAGDVVTAQGKVENLKVDSGTVQELPPFSVTMPRRPGAEQLTFSASLSDGKSVAANEWSFWVFPEERLSAGKLSVVGFEAVRQLYPWTKASVSTSNDGELLVTGEWNVATVDFLEQGGRVLLLAPEKVLPTVVCGFRPSGWDPAAREGHLGSIFDPGHPALRCMPSDGWCDLQFYSLAQGGRAVLLEEVPGNLQPIVRCIDMPQRLWNKAYLVEAAVGKGRLLVSGFNFAGALSAGDPAGAYLLDQLIRYALSTEFAPSQSLPVERLRNGYHSK